MVIKKNSKTLLIMRGVPGSGKSTWIRNHNVQDYVLSPDTFRIMLSKPVETEINGIKTLGINQNVSKEAWKYTNEFLKIRLSNGSMTIVDACHTNGNLDNYEQLAKQYGFELVIIDFLCNVTKEIATQRNELRKNSISYVPKFVIARMYENSQKQDLTRLNVVSYNEIEFE